jgi:anti-sigma factor RsiW
MMSSAPAPERPATLDADTLVAYVAGTLSDEERAQVERDAARDARARQALVQAWRIVDPLRRLDLAAIRARVDAGGPEAAIASAYLSWLTCQVQPSPSGLADMLRAGGDAARLAWSTLSAVLGAASVGSRGFAPVLRSGRAAVVSERPDAVAFRVEWGEQEVTVVPEHPERLFVAIEVGSQRLPLGHSPEPGGAVRIPLPPSRFDGGRLILNSGEWPARTDTPPAVFAIEDRIETWARLSDWARIEEDSLRLTLTDCDLAGPGRIVVAFSAAPDRWQPLGTWTVAEVSREIPMAFEYPAAPGRFPWPLRFEWHPS